MNQSLNETLRQSRKAKGYTQEQLAQLLHVSRQTISNWETGRASPDYELLKQLSALLETRCPPCWAWRRSPPPRRPWSRWRNRLWRKASRNRPLHPKSVGCGRC